MHQTKETPVRQRSLLTTVLLGFVQFSAALLSTLLMLLFLKGLFFSSGSTAPGGNVKVSGYDTMDRFDMYMTNAVSQALDGVLSIKKVYWLSDQDLVAPEPDQSAFGESEDASSLQWLLDDAAALLDGQQTLFSTDTPVWGKAPVRYYLDETIFTVTWKQVIDNVVYTISEVKIADPSQFRRFLADGEYGSSRQYLTTEMASSVNAVVASAGDFYKYRQGGIVVWEGKVRRFNQDRMETCGIDNKGNLVFMRRGQFESIEQAQAFVDENNIRFTLSFGPILIENYECCEPKSYVVGEINDEFSRSAICQMGDLHYLMVVANAESRYSNYPTLHTFAKRIQEFGCEKAYTLDGGQTATIVMNDKLINRVSYGAQRQISDIVYFATAIPSKSK